MVFDEYSPLEATAGNIRCDRTTAQHSPCVHICMHLKCQEKLFENDCAPLYTVPGVYEVAKQLPFRKGQVVSVLISGILHQGNLHCLEL